MAEQEGRKAGRQEFKAGIQGGKAGRREIKGRKDERQACSCLSSFRLRLLLRAVAGHWLHADDAELRHRGGGRCARGWSARCGGRGRPAPPPPPPPPPSQLPGRPPSSPRARRRAVAPRG